MAASRGFRGRDRKLTFGSKDAGAMASQLKTVDSAGDIAAAMQEIGRRARAAAHVLALAPTAQKNDALIAMAGALRADKDKILAANLEDVAEGKKSGMTPVLLDRLTL